MSFISLCQRLTSSSQPPRSDASHRCQPQDPPREKAKRELHCVAAVSASFLHHVRATTAPLSSNRPCSNRAVEQQPSVK
ncbi:hypothetical protein SESBI_09689 [Sesbania bispinosa]|nr:hypothetical protein SESBI_09689 [Sesbania bispinosa]